MLVKRSRVGVNSVNSGGELNFNACHFFFSFSLITRGHIIVAKPIVILRFVFSLINIINILLSNN